MIVCLCRGVSERVVRLAVLQGARTLDDIGDACGAGEGCGSCHEELARMAGEVASHGGAGACASALGVRDCFEVPASVPFRAEGDAERR